MTRVEIPVQGMSCGGCERAVQAALSQLEGVSSAEADHTAGRVRVSYDPGQVDEQRLRTQIEDAGYQPAAA
jgi:copper chaperone